jgi:hypothetical protein
MERQEGQIKRRAKNVVPKSRGNNEGRRVGAKTEVQKKAKASAKTEGKKLNNGKKRKRKIKRGKNAKNPKIGMLLLWYPMTLAL